MVDQQKSGNIVAFIDACCDNQSDKKAFMESKNKVITYVESNQK